jgi:hypothetical protein
VVDDQIDDILDRINSHNLERIRASCEADGDRELVDIISAKLANERQASATGYSASRALGI